MPIRDQGTTSVSSSLLERNSDRLVLRISDEVIKRYLGMKTRRGQLAGMSFSTQLNETSGQSLPRLFHRMLLFSIYRVRNSDEEKHDIVLIFNSLDQIASQFPLCARE